jgi:hypothetical protein
MLAAQTRKEMARLLEQARTRVGAVTREPPDDAAPKKAAAVKEDIQAAVKAAETVVPDVTPPVAPDVTPPVDTQSGGWFSWLTGSGAPAAPAAPTSGKDDKRADKTDSKTDDEGKTADKGKTADSKIDEGKTVDEQTDKSKTADEGKTADSKTDDEGKTADKGKTADSKIDEGKTVDEGKTEEKTQDKYDVLDDPVRQAAKKQPSNVTYAHLQACFLALEAVTLAATPAAIKSESTSDTAAEAAIFAADQREQIVHSLPWFAQRPLVSDCFRRVSAKLYHAGRNDLSHDLFMVVDKCGSNMPFGTAPARASDWQQDADIGDCRCRCCGFMERSTSTLTPEFVNELRAKEGLPLLTFSDKDGEVEAATALYYSSADLTDKDTQAYFRLLAAVVFRRDLNAWMQTLPYNEAFDELVQCQQRRFQLPTDPVDLRMLSAAGLLTY